MKQSQQVLEWQREAREETRVETTREHLLEALRLRFQSTVPDDLAAAIAQMNDLGQLSRWFQASQTADSLDEFRRAMQNGAATGTAPDRASGAQGG